MIRTYALRLPATQFYLIGTHRWNLWQRKWAVVIPLSVLAVVHWALLWRGTFLFTAAWEPASATCVVTAADARFLQVTFFYSQWP